MQPSVLGQVEEIKWKLLRFALVGKKAANVHVILIIARTHFMPKSMSQMFCPGSNISVIYTVTCLFQYDSLTNSSNTYWLPFHPP